MRDITAKPSPGAPGEISSFAKVHVVYDPNGIPHVGDLSAKDLEMLGISLQQLELPNYTIAALQAMNIQHVAVRSKPEGVYLYVNGKALPHLVWGEDYLNNAADLYVHLYQWTYNKAVLNVVQQVVPLLDNADVEFIVEFPRMAGVEAIPLPEG
ncbi:MAG TPA: hypothetical protein EYP04_13435 [Anaerolineae bacterium]|nr:hypothetical protein [Anaerolineae bacterium]